METRKSFREHRILGSIISFLLMFGVYAAVISRMYRAGRFEEPDGGSALGIAILILIAGGVALHIVVTVALTAFAAARHGYDKSDFVVDERDRSIELKSLRISTSVTGIGFVLAMIALAAGQSSFLAFQVIVAAFGAGSLAAEFDMLRAHRQGA